MSFQYHGITDPAGKDFSLALTILFPVYLAVCLVAFRAAQPSSLFLRKRSFRLLVWGALGSLVIWSCTVLYDVLGASHYNCALFVFLNYASNPAVSYFLMLKLTGYVSKLAMLRLTRLLHEEANAGLVLQGGGGLDETRSVASSATEPSPHGGNNKPRNRAVEDGEGGGVVFFPDPLKGEVSLASLSGHLRVVFLQSRSRKHQILNAKFSRTWAFAVLWFFLTMFPFFLVYFFRLGMNPQWMDQYGCELEETDAGLLVGTAVFALGLSLLSFRKVLFKSSLMRKRDALLITRECIVGWHCAGSIYILAYALFLADPGQLYARGYFNWRNVVVFSGMALFYVQTIHQIILSHLLKTRLILSSQQFSSGERLKDVLANAELKRDLQKFLEAELSTEILDFISAVEQYRQAYDKERSLGDGNLMYDTFIASGAFREVNISHQVRKPIEVTHAAGGPFEKETFDLAYEEVRRNFLADNFARYIKTLAAKEDEAKQLRQTHYPHHHRASKNSKGSKAVSSAVSAVRDDTNDV